MCSKFLNRKKQSRVNSLVKSTAPPNYAYLFYLQSTDVESGDCTRATVSERAERARSLVCYLLLLPRLWPAIFRPTGNYQQVHTTHSERVERSSAICCYSRVNDPQSIYNNGICKASNVVNAWFELGLINY